MVDLKELDNFKTSLEKFQYLVGLKDLSWRDCQDAWFMSVKLLPEIRKELQTYKTQCATSAEVIARLTGRLHEAEWSLQYINERVMPGECDSIDVMKTIIKQHKTQGELLRMRDNKSYDDSCKIHELSMEIDRMKRVVVAAEHVRDEIHLLDRYHDGYLTNGNSYPELKDALEGLKK